MRLMWGAVDSTAKPECKTLKGKAFSFDLSTFGWYNDERQEVKAKMKTKETTEKYKSLRSSPFSLLFWVMKKQVTKNMTPFKRNMSHSASGESIYFTEVLPDCKWTECEIKAELQQKILKREQKGRICRNHSSKSDQTLQNSDLEKDVDPWILLGSRSAVTVKRRRLRQGPFR